jgi:hypothetical protein
MTIDLRRSFAFAACVFIFAASAAADPVPGTTGSAAGAECEWQSSWLDIKPPLTFKKGEVLRIKVDGDAENVLVRLLPSTSHPSSSDGIEGNVRKVPADKIVEVKLERDHPDVKQISVHACKKAWTTPLGGNNGTVIVVNIDRNTK